MTTSDIPIDPHASNSGADKEPVTSKPPASNATPEDPGSNSSEMTITASVSNRLNALLALARERLRPGIDQSLQDELASLLKLIPEIDNSYYAKFAPLAEIALQSLLSETPNLALAKGIRRGIEENVHRSTLQILLHGGSPPTHVIRGLGTLLFTLIPLPFVATMIVQTYYPKLVATYNRLFGSDATELVLVIAIAGAVGSAVSIMVRIQDNESLKENDPTILFLIGLFKPIIGVAFALFVFAVLKSQLLPVQVVTPNEYYFFTALAFVAGFSERFAKDIVARTEKAFANDRPPEG